MVVVNGWKEPGSGADVMRRSRLSVGFLLTEDFELLAFSSFVDQLRVSANGGRAKGQPLCSWSTMTVDGAPIRSSCGLTIQGVNELQDPRNFDYVVVIGGPFLTDQPLEAPLAQYLKRVAQSGVKLVGICTGSFALCRAGLMAGRRCCVSWYHYHDLVEAHPECEPVGDRLFVVDGERITCAGGSAAADLASHLIDRHLGPAIAQQARHFLFLEPARRANDAQPRPPAIRCVDDDRVRRALLLMEQHIAEPLAIEDVAARSGISLRQLERLFHAALGVRPAAYYRSVRLRYACWLLANTTLSVTEIAVDAGYTDCAHFSRQFKAAFGCRPSSARTAGRAEGLEDADVPNIAFARQARRNPQGAPSAQAPGLGTRAYAGEVIGV